MSLVTDAYLFELWKAAQAASEAEAPGRTFWNQVLSKYIFVGKEYVVASEEPPSSANNKRRVDIVVKYFEPPNYSIRILCFVEAKRPNADLSLIDEVEHQAFDACAGYLSTNKLQHIYAMTTIGTRARLWIYRPDSDYLEPLFGSQDLSDRSAYVEAHSSDAQKLTEGFHQMKNMPPTSKVSTSKSGAVIAPSSHAQSSTASTSSAASVQAAASQWVWDEERKRYRYFNHPTRQWVWQEK